MGEVVGEVDGFEFAVQLDVDEYWYVVIGVGGDELEWVWVGVVGELGAYC